MNYRGIIIKESLEKDEILDKLKITETEIESVTEEHRTPWVKQWTMFTFEIKENIADDIAKELSESLDSKHNWYTDFKNDNFHYIIFHKKIFRVDRSRKEQYKDVVNYGISIGIPDYQLDFSPSMNEWER